MVSGSYLKCCAACADVREGVCLRSGEVRLHGDACGLGSHWFWSWWRVQDGAGGETCSQQPHGSWLEEDTNHYTIKIYT